MILSSLVIAIIISRSWASDHATVFDFYNKGIDNKNRGYMAKMKTASRNKRQSHPAATVARFPEFPSSEFNNHRPDQELPELIDYLTPPRPPEILSNDNHDRDIGSIPIPLPVTSSSSSQERRIPVDEINGKWNLGYNPSDLLYPPTDPFSIRSESRYVTINRLVPPRNPNRGDDGDEIIIPFALRGNLERVDLKEPSTVSTTEKLNFNFDTTEFNIEDSKSKFRPIVNLKNFNQNNIQIETQSVQTTPTPSSFIDKRHTSIASSWNDRKARKNFKYTNKRESDDYNDDGGERYSEEDEDDHEDKKSKSTGPVYTFVKTDKHGHYKWGVRHGHLRK